MPKPFSPQPAGLPLLAPGRPYLPAVYHLPDGTERGATVDERPRVLLLEVGNTGTPARHLGMMELAQIILQFPHMGRVILTGPSDPLTNEDLPDIIGLLKLRDVYVAVETDGTLLTPALAADLVRSRPDEVRVLMRAGSKQRGAGEGVRLLAEARARVSGSHKPRLVLRCPARRDVIQELPALVRCTAEAGADELYLERLVYPPGEGNALATQSVFGAYPPYLDEILSECEALSLESGIALRAAGGRDPRNSLASAARAGTMPWQACLRPWRAIYIRRDGTCRPCRTAAQATPDSGAVLMGNVFEEPVAAIWNGKAYREFRSRLLGDAPQAACAGCGVRWSL